MGHGGYHTWLYVTKSSRHGAEWRWDARQVCHRKLEWFAFLLDAAS